MTLFDNRQHFRRCPNKSNPQDLLLTFSLVDRVNIQLFLAFQETNSQKMEYRSEEYSVKVHAPPNEAASQVLTEDVLRFVGLLCHKYDDRRRTLLAARKCRAQEFDAGNHHP